MFMSDVNDIKIYNLSAGKSLPEVSFFKLYETSLKIQILFTVGHRQEETFKTFEESRFQKTNRTDTRL